MGVSTDAVLFYGYSDVAMLIRVTTYLPGKTPTVRWFWSESEMRRRFTYPFCAYILVEYLSIEDSRTELISLTQLGGFVG
jgi:hypothetical protein